jgi:hypothetical protein
MMSFTIPSLGRFHWNVLAQGLKVAPSIFQRRTEALIAPFDFAKVYIDDFIIGGMTEDECAANINTILATIQANGFTVNMDKSILLPHSAIPALGFTLSHNSVIPKDSYILGLREMEKPNDIKSLRRYLGKLSFVTPMYPSIQPLKAALFAVLTLSKNKPFRWTTVANQCFNKIRDILLLPMQLSHLDPDVSKPVELYVDAGDTGFAGNLYQDDKLVGAISRKYHVASLSTASPGAREAFALRESLFYFRDKIQGRHVDAYSDNQALSRLIHQDSIRSPMLARIVSDISEFLDNLTLNWVPRSHLRIQLVDQLGRS